MQVCSPFDKFGIAKFRKRNSDCIFYARISNGTQENDRAINQGFYYLLSFFYKHTSGVEFAC